MTTAYLEGLRTTRYRRRLAALLRRPACRSISFAIGTAPIHRNFFSETASAIEGLPTGGTRKWNGVTHRQVQYGVRLRIDETTDEATYDAERDLLLVPAESAFDTIDGQVRLLSACVHVGLNFEGRNLHQLDSECAARIAGQLFRLFESVGDRDSELEIVEKIKRLEPESPRDKAFYDVARETLLYLHTTSHAKVQLFHKLKPGSFMKIISIAKRDMLHDVLQQGTVRSWRAPAKPKIKVARPPSRFLALQEMEPSTAVLA